MVPPQQTQSRFHVSLKLQQDHPLKATFPLKLLAEAVRAASAIVPSRTTKDILKNVMLEVYDGQASVSASDTENSIAYYVRGVDVKLRGCVLLPAAKFGSILSEVQGDTIEIELVNGIAKIEAGRAKFKIQTEDAAGFPPPPTFEEEAFVTVKAHELKRMLVRSIFCCEDFRSFSTRNVQLAVSKGRLTCVATDSRRMTVDSADVSCSGLDDGYSASALIPQRAATVVSRLIGEGTVDISFLANSITVRTGAFTASLQHEAGRFPDWTKIVSNNHATCTCDLAVAPAISALNQAMITTSEETRGAVFVFKDGVLSISCSASSVGESRIETPVAMTGEATITLSPQYVRDALSVAKPADTVEIRVFDGESPLQIRTPDGWIHIVMPLSVDR